MQGNDIGTMFGRRIAVVMEPLVIARNGSPRFKLNKEKRIEADAERWKVDGAACNWVISMGRRFSLPCEMWSFLPEEIFARVMMPVERICGDYVVEYKRWAHPSEAYQYLRATPEIDTVYDADLDRCQLYWQFRGYHYEREPQQ